ncbi:MAG: leucine-rich repeat protein [Treponema sp.]|nr:leucine-rich repeat protein [Treponema sp.]
MKKRPHIMTVLCTLATLLTFTTGCNVDSDSTTYYTVSFDSNGGTFVTSQSVESGKKAVEPKSPTRTDYIFVAWNKGDSAFDFSTPITAGITLTAHWKATSENENNANNNVNTDGKDDDSGNNGGAGQVITLTAESLASLSLSDSSYGDTYTLKLSGEWTNDDILALGSKVKAISGKKISVDMTQTTGITEIGSEAFRNASSLVSVHLPNTLESIGWCAFNRCTALMSIEIPASVTEVNTCIFQDCTALESVTFLDCALSINSWNFKGCTALTTVNFGSNITGIGHESFADCTALTNIEIPESISGMSDQCGLVIDNIKHFYVLLLQCSYGWQ